MPLPKDPIKRANYLKKRSLLMKKLWKDKNSHLGSDEWKSKISNSLKGRTLSKEHKKNISKAKKGTIVSEETKQKISKSTKKELNHFFGKKHSEFSKNKISSSLTGRIINGEWRAKLKKSAKRGKESHCWQGGLSKKTYRSQSNSLFRQKIRKLFNNACYLCDGIGRDVHHINYDETYDYVYNVFLLCRGCHAKTNINRDYWLAFFCFQKNKEVCELF